MGFPLPLDKARPSLQSDSNDKSCRIKLHTISCSCCVYNYIFNLVTGTRATGVMKMV